DGQRHLVAGLLVRHRRAQLPDAGDRLAVDLGDDVAAGRGLVGRGRLAALDAGLVGAAARVDRLHDHALLDGQVHRRLDRRAGDAEEAALDVALLELGQGLLGGALDHVRGGEDAALLVDDEARAGGDAALGGGPEVDRGLRLLHDLGPDVDDAGGVALVDVARAQAAGRPLDVGLGDRRLLDD